jgi:hypothetical protein
MRLDESNITKDRQIYTKARVDSELNVIMEELDDLDLDWPQVPEKRSKAKKSDLVAALVTARKTLRSYDAENWEENTKSKIKERYEGQIRDPAEIIEEELLLPFYTFDGDAKISTIATEMIEFKFGDEHECRRRGQKRHFECDGLYHEFLDEFKNRN